MKLIRVLIAARLLALPQQTMNSIILDEFYQQWYRLSLN